MTVGNTADVLNTRSLPIVQSTRLGDGWIQLRELLLNLVSGVSHGPVINDELATESPTPKADLASRLKIRLAKLKALAMDPDGLKVDYEALYNSEAYTAYRQEELAALQQFDPQQLLSVEASRAFWINLYNALVIDAVISFDVQKSVTEGRLGMMTFFRQAAYMVSGQRMSLEDIEHGILRGNRGNPYVLGAHFPASDPRLDWSLPLDPRVHFALNCGGRSCPPIRTYEAEKLDQQLDLATHAYLNAEVEVRPDQKELVLSQIFRWYAADFSGGDNLIQFLVDYLPDGEKRRLLLSSGHDLRIVYKPYDWRLNVL
ncbi:MAG: DUF547 domain-containing protein [Chloroflexi bacterium]|jgi:hypothetical protein|nr:DUF547 domain-containing protein [Chloroflexota bacterium]